MKADPDGIIFVIRNGSNGAYIHKSLFKIKTFQTRYSALKYMRQNGLNENIYKIKEMKRCQLQ